MLAVTIPNLMRAYGPGLTSALVSLALVGGCSPRADEPSTPLPTRQTTIDPVNKKLDAAQQDAERRRAEADSAGK
jgi:hypothetical protein